MGKYSMIAVAVLLAMGLTACGSGDGNASNVNIESDDKFDLNGQTIRIGTAEEEQLDIGTSYAIEVLRNWGATVERIELTDISGVEAIVADRIDISGRSSDEVVDAQARGINLVAFGAPSSEMHYVIIGSKDIESVADLEGRRVATSGPGGYDTLLFSALLEEESLALGENVEEVAIGNSSARTQTVVTDQADAAMVFLDDWLALQNQTEDLQLVGYISDLMPGLSSRTLAAEQAYLENNPKLAQAMACANLEANRWINDSPEEYVTFTTERLNTVSEEDVRVFYDRAMEMNMFPTDVGKILSPDAYQRTADVMGLSGEVDAEDAVDTSYLEKAADQGCGQPE